MSRSTVQAWDVDSARWESGSQRGKGIYLFGGHTVAVVTIRANLSPRKFLFIRGFLLVGFVVLFLRISLVLVKCPGHSSGWLWLYQDCRFPVTILSVTAGTALWLPCLQNQKQRMPSDLCFFLHYVQLLDGDSYKA